MKIHHMPRFSGHLRHGNFLKGTKTNNATIRLHLSKILSETKAAHLF